MSNLFNPARQGLLRGEIVWKEGGSVIKASLLRGYTFNVDHKFLSDVIGAGGTIVATETLTALESSVTGRASAANAVWEAVPEGPPIPGVVIYQSSAVTGGADVPDAEKRLIALVDRGSGVTLSIQPNGQDITGRWSPGADGIFRI